MLDQLTIKIPNYITQYTAKVNLTSDNYLLKLSHVVSINICIDDLQHRTSLQSWDSLRRVRGRNKKAATAREPVAHVHPPATVRSYFGSNAPNKRLLCPTASLVLNVTSSSLTYKVINYNFEISSKKQMVYRYASNCQNNYRA